MDTFSVFTDFLLSKGFKLIEDNKKIFVIKYELNGFYVKIVQERIRTGGMAYYIDLSRVNNHPSEGWYSMDIVRCLILNSDYVLDRTLMFDEHSKFFMEHYPEILQTFTSQNFPIVEAKMSTLENQRAKAMFG